MTEQTKDEREAKEAKNYLGNVKVIWTDGQNVSTADQPTQAAMQMQQPARDISEDPDLPF